VKKRLCNLLLKTHQ